MDKTDAARADLTYAFVCIMHDNPSYKKILQSACYGARGNDLIVSIYSKDGQIIAEEEFSVIRPTKIISWFEKHRNDSPTGIFASMKKITAEIEALDTIVMDLPLTMRLFELCRESIKDDIHLHTLTSALLDLRTQKECLTMDDYPAILKMADINPEEPETQEALEDISEDY